MVCCFTDIALTQLIQYQSSKHLLPSSQQEGSLKRLRPNSAPASASEIGESSTNDEELHYVQMEATSDPVPDPPAPLLLSLLLKVAPSLAGFSIYPKTSSDLLPVTSITRRFLVSADDDEQAEEQSLTVLQEFRASPSVWSIQHCAADDSWNVMATLSSDILDSWQLQRVDRHTGSRAWGCHADVRALALKAPIHISVSFSSTPCDAALSSSSMAPPPVPQLQLNVLQQYAFALSASTGLAGFQLSKSFSRAVKTLQTDYLLAFQQKLKDSGGLVGKVSGLYDAEDQVSVKDRLLELHTGQRLVVLQLASLHDHAPSVIKLPSKGSVFLVNEKIGKKGPWALLKEKHVPRLEGSAGVTTGKGLAGCGVSDVFSGWPSSLGSPPKVLSLATIDMQNPTVVFRLDGRLDMTLKDNTFCRQLVKRKSTSEYEPLSLGPQVYDAPSIPLLILFARTSDEGARDRRPTTLARQILSSASDLPPCVNVDMSNVAEVRIIGELCSSSAHAAQDRLTLEALFQGVPEGTVVLATNPDRLGRRQEDRVFIRSAARKAGVHILVQGVPERSETLDEEPEEGESAQEVVMEAEQEDEIQQGVRAWRDLDGAEAPLIDEACKNSLVLSHEVGLYSASASLLDRVMQLENFNIPILQQWLLQTCKRESIKSITVFSRTSTPNASSIRRQSSFGLCLAGVAKSSGISVSKLSMDGVSAYSGSCITDAFDSDDFNGCLILTVRIDRLCRTEEQWEAIQKLAAARRQIWVACLWPLEDLRNLLAASQHLPETSYSHFLSLEKSRALPVLLPTVVTGSKDQSLREICLRRMLAGLKFIGGFRASSYEGSRRIIIPSSMVQDKGVKVGVEADLCQVINEQYDLQSMGIQVSGRVYRPKGGSTRDLWVCRCQTDANLHKEGCRCGCTTCRHLDDLCCPSKTAESGRCPPFCPCTCAEHHKTSSAAHVTAPADSAVSISSEPIQSSVEPSTIHESSTSVDGSVASTTSNNSVSNADVQRVCGCGASIAARRRGGQCGSCANRATRERKKEKESSGKHCAGANGLACERTAVRRPVGTPSGTPEVCTVCYEALRRQRQKNTKV